MTNKFESIIKKTPTNKSPGQEGFAGGFCQTFPEEQTPILPMLFEKIQEEGRLPSSSYEASIILIQKLDKDITKLENYRPISLLNIHAKSPMKYWQTKFSNTLKRSHTMIKWDLFHGCKVG